MTVAFIPIALITCMVGLASCLAGAHHLRIWRTESLAAAAATSVIAWCLTLLSMGLAAKEIKTEYGRSKRLVCHRSHPNPFLFFEKLYSHHSLLESIGAISSAPSTILYFVGFAESSGGSHDHFVVHGASVPASDSRRIRDSRGICECARRQGREEPQLRHTCSNRSLNAVE